MARPKKQTEQKVKHNIMLRLTDTQYEIVSEYARLMGLPVAVYAREVITEGRHPIQCNIVRDDENLNKAIAQLSRIGNNLNQMMRYLHQGGLLTPEIQKDLHDSICEIYRLSEYFDCMESDKSYGNLKTHSE